MGVDGPLLTRKLVPSRLPTATGHRLLLLGPNLRQRRSQRGQNPRMNTSKRHPTPQRRSSRRKTGLRREQQGVMSPRLVIRRLTTELIVMTDRIVTLSLRLHPPRRRHRQTHDIKANLVVVPLLFPDWNGQVQSIPPRVVRRSVFPALGLDARQVFATLSMAPVRCQIHKLGGIVAPAPSTGPTGLINSPHQRVPAMPKLLSVRKRFPRVDSAQIRSSPTFTLHKTGAKGLVSISITPQKSLTPTILGLRVD